MINGLPEKIKALRKKYRFSQKDVSEKLNLSPSIVSGYETGERTPSTEVILALSRLYHCSADYLLGNDISNVPNATLNVDGLSDEQIYALQLLINSMKQ